MKKLILFFMMLILFSSFASATPLEWNPSSLDTIVRSAWVGTANFSQNANDNNDASSGTYSTRSGGFGDTATYTITFHNPTYVNKIRFKYSGFETTAPIGTKYKRLQSNLGDICNLGNSGDITCDVNATVTYIRAIWHCQQCNSVQNRIYEFQYEDENFKVRLNDSFDGSNLENFTTTINGTTYNSTIILNRPDMLITDVSRQSFEEINLTLYKDGYYPKEYNNYNVTENLYGLMAHYFTIYNLKYMDNATINIFNATINGTVYNTTTGIIITPLPSDSSSLFNVTIKSNTFFNRTYLNLNLSSNLIAQQWQGELYLNATEVITDNSLNGLFTYDWQTVNSTTSLKLNAGTYDITFSNVSYFDKSQNFTIASLENKSETLTGVGNILFNLTTLDSLSSLPLDNFSGVIQNHSYSELFNTTGFYLEIFSLDGYYNITADKGGYFNNSILNYNATIPLTIYNISIVLESENSLNITFYYELNWSQFNEDIELEVIGDLFAQNFTVHNGAFNISFIPEAEYIFRYTADGYNERHYWIYLDDTISANLQLYLLDNVSATEVDGIVRDNSNNEIENVYVKVLKYHITTNSYRTVEIGKTNFEGLAQFQIEINKEFYKFILVYEDDIKKITTPSYIYENLLNFQINLVGETGEHFKVIEGIEGALTFDNNTNKFYFVYNDPSNVVYQGCIDVYILKNTGKTLFNSSCAYGSAGTTTVYTPEVNGTTYEAIATVGFNPIAEYWGSMIKSFYETMPDLDGFGMFLIGLLTISLAFISLWSVPIAVLVAPLPLVFGSFLHIIPVEPYIMIGLEIVAIIIAYLISDKT